MSQSSAWIAMEKHYYIDHDIPAHVKRMEHYLLTHLQALRGQFACVAAGRGKGLPAAMEFDSDIAGRVATYATEGDVLLNTARPKYRPLHATSHHHRGGN